MPFKERTRTVPVYRDKSGKGDIVGWVTVQDTHIRWRWIFRWILVFTIIVFFVLLDNRRIAGENKSNKADVIALKRSDCNNRIFMISSRQFRLRSYYDRKNKAKFLIGTARIEELKKAAQDLQGARTSRIIANNLAPNGCAKELGLEVPTNDKP